MVFGPNHFSLLVMSRIPTLLDKLIDSTSMKCFLIYGNLLFVNYSHCLEASMSTSITFKLPRFPFISCSSDSFKSLIHTLMINPPMLTSSWFTWDGSLKEHSSSTSSHFDPTPQICSKWLQDNITFSFLKIPLRKGEK